MLSNVNVVESFPEYSKIEDYDISNFGLGCMFSHDGRVNRRTPAKLAVYERALKVFRVIKKTTYFMSQYRFTVFQNILIDGPDTIYIKNVYFVLFDGFKCILNCLHGRIRPGIVMVQDVAKFSVNCSDFICIPISIHSSATI